ncbi:MAG: biotin/lipoyl-containing protein, partial [Planctomycetota bacterium]
MIVELRIPESGESIAEVQIGDWQKSEGDYVEQDQIVVEIETDKATMELPAPVSGTITKILKQSGEMVNVGDIIAYIDESAKAPESKSAEEVRQQADEQVNVAPQARIEDQPPVAPSVRRVLAEYGLQASEVAGSGPGGR